MKTEVFSVHPQFSAWLQTFFFPDPKMSFSTPVLRPGLKHYQLSSDLKFFRLERQHKIHSEFACYLSLLYSFVTETTGRLKLSYSSPQTKCAKSISVFRPKRYKYQQYHVQMPKSHWFLSINSYYLQPYWPLQHTSVQTKPQRYIRSHY